MSTELKSELLERLTCPKCGQTVKPVLKGRLECIGCGTKIPIVNGKPIFTPVPLGMQAAPKLVRGPNEGSTWRQANWRFLEKVIGNLPQKAVILDFGAGHGDFNQVLCKRTVIALDVFPYEEVDLVCDIQKAVPFKKSSFDVIVLMNVLEHVQQPVKLLKTLATLLHPSGSLVITVPFLLKLHQMPYDFYRFSHHQLENMGHAAGLEIAAIEGYYDPILMMKESALNVRSFATPGMPFLTRKLSRLLLEISTWFVSGIGCLIGRGHVGDPSVEKSPYPIGYHIIFHTKKGKKK
jgi:SAM-dependent methyltransferase